jgi:2-polyprenyl-3-methyl-5-hydroxy-6-metoxy-1,4-benzoquinol methylase
METPLTRPDTVNRLIFAADAAFAMLAGMQLDLFTPLKGRSMTAEDIAQAIGVSPARLRLLLYALVAAGLLSEKDGHFSNTPESERLLVKDSPSYMGDIHRLLSYRWVSNLPKTAESLRSGVPQAKVDFSSSSEQEVEAFLRRINALTVVAARALLDRYDFSSCKTLADVGCGGAGLALAIAQACPHIQVTAIDLPLVTPIAQRIVEEQRAADRVKVIAADVLSGPLTGSYEVMIARALLQVLPSDQAKLAVKNIGAAIKPGGKIYILAQILDDSRTSPLEAVGYNLRFINTFDAGESYTQQEHRDWLTAAGFVNIERANFLLPDEHGLITARKHAG